MSRSAVCHPSIIDRPENFFVARLEKQQLTLDLVELSNDLEFLMSSGDPATVEVRVAGMGTSKTFQMPSIHEVRGANLNLSDLDGFEDRDIEVRVMTHDAEGKILHQWWHALPKPRSKNAADDMEGITSDTLGPWEIELSWEDRLIVVMGESISKASQEGDQSAKNQILDRMLIDIWDDAATGPAMQRMQARLAQGGLWPAPETGLGQWLNNAHKELST